MGKFNKEPIRCVRHRAWELAWTEYRAPTIIIIIIALLLLPLVFVSFNFLVIIIAFFSIYLGSIHAKVHKRFMSEFAKDNGFKYTENIPLSFVKGKFFKFGHSQRISHVVSGDYKEHSMRLFNFRATTGHGRNSRSHFFTVFEVFFKKTQFPHILLQSRKMRKYSKGGNRISLEDEFKKDFQLFCIDGYEIEVLQIFTPEILRFIKDKKLKFSVEFIEDRMYVYDNIRISKREHLLELFKLVGETLESVGPLLNRLHNDFEVLHKYYNRP